MALREVTIITGTGAKILCRKSHSGKSVHAIRFEKDARFTAMVNDGEQHHAQTGVEIRGFDATGRYGMTLRELVKFIQYKVDRPIYESWVFK